MATLFDTHPSDETAEYGYFTPSLIADMAMIEQHREHTVDAFFARTASIVR